MMPTVNNRTHILCEKYVFQSHRVWTGQDHDDANSEQQDTYSL
jgi:hypothetical protein